MVSVPIVPVLEWNLTVATHLLRVWHMKTSGHECNFRYLRSSWSDRLFEVLECECGRAWRI